MVVFRQVYRGEDVDGLKQQTFKVDMELNWEPTRLQSSGAAQAR